MRQDWEANREALLAFWRSGEYTMTDTLAEFGLNVLYASMAIRAWLTPHAALGGEAVRLGKSCNPNCNPNAARLSKQCSSKGRETKD